MMQSWISLIKCLQNEKIKSKNSKIQLGQNVSMTKVNMKSGVKHIGKVYLQIFNVGHGGEERTLGNKRKI